MTPTQTRIYKLIKKGEIMNITEMAKEMNMSRQNFYEQLKKIIAKGKIKEQPRFIVVE